MFEGKKEELHISELCYLGIYVRLEENLRNGLFQQRRYSEFADCTRALFNKWRKDTASIPVEALMRFSELSKIPLENIEKGIKSVRGKRAGHIIVNPRFPLKLSLSAIRLVTNLIERASPGEREWLYIARTRFLGDLFIEEIEKVFGSIYPKLKVTGSDKRNRVVIPIPVMKALTTWIAKYEEITAEEVIKNITEGVPKIFKICEENRLICLQALCDDIFAPAKNQLVFYIGKGRGELIENFKSWLENFGVSCTMQPKENPRKIVVTQGGAIRNFYKKIKFRDQTDQEKLEIIMKTSGGFAKDIFCSVCGGILYPSKTGAKSHKCSKCGLETDVKLSSR